MTSHVKTKTSACASSLHDNQKAQVTKFDQLNLRGLGHSDGWRIGGVGYASERNPFQEAHANVESITVGLRTARPNIALINTRQGFGCQGHRAAAKPRS